eukprot:g11982.t1
MDANFALSIMLIGTVAFILTLFYLLNSNDKDVKRFSWGVLSASICTFMGVRLGTAYNANWSYYESWLYCSDTVVTFFARFGFVAGCWS